MRRRTAYEDGSQNQLLDEMRGSGGDVPESIARELVSIARSMVGAQGVLGPIVDTRGREVPPIPRGLMKKVRKKVDRLNEVTDGKFKFSFGYIGNMWRNVDDRSWRLFHDNGIKSMARYRAEETSEFPKLAKWILSLPEDEEKLVKVMKMRRSGWGERMGSGLGERSRRSARRRVGYGRIKWERSHFIPKAAHGAENIRKADVPEGVDVEIYTWERGSQLFGVAFQGRSQKPLWQYSFRNEADRDKRVGNTIEDRQGYLEEKRMRLEERRKYRHDYQVGDILSGSWGYDQTNVDFYEVVGVTDKSVVIRPVAQRVRRSNPPADYVVPVPGKFTGGKMTKRVSQGGRVRIDSVVSAGRWDGKPKYQTSSGWGH